MRPFIAFICKLPDARYCALFPDLPGCSATGETIAETLANAGGALALYCQQMHETDTPIPEPSFAPDLGPNQPDGLIALIRPPEQNGVGEASADPLETGGVTPPAPDIDVGAGRNHRVRL